MCGEPVAMSCAAVWSYVVVVRLLVSVLMTAVFGLGMLSGYQAPAMSHAGYSLRFYGSGVNDIDRVKIALTPDRPINLGGAFTLEFWLKALAQENRRRHVPPAIAPGSAATS
ncbi:MAG: hypothetical protein HC822_18150 [Oscillochloris sp.]|nr:hypothetical protein [Oscillochloris sp.]